MHPADFLKTLYLGDRGCKGLNIDTWNETVSMVVTEVSRVRSETGDWNFYTDEDIENGHVVFNGVKSLTFHPPGVLPNDKINYITSY